jgi:photosystem II stability/assembly factor-like uncharacterized protein
MDPTTQRLMMAASSGVEGVNWTDHSFSLRTDATSSVKNWRLNRIIYANNLPTPAFFAVGNAGTIAKSTDGITWTYNTTVATAMGNNNFLGIGYDPTNNILIACGTAGIYYRSTDGISWTAYTQGSNTLQSCRFLNGAFWMVGNAGTILKSTNGGTVWTAQSPVAAHASYIIYDIGYGSISNTTDKWMYVGEAGLVAYSANGTGTWVNVRSPITTGTPTFNNLLTIIFVPFNVYATTGQFLISGAREVSSFPVPALYRSVNATTSFVLVTGYTPAVDSYMRSVYYNGSLTAKYIMITDGELWTSADSTTWTKVLTPFPITNDVNSNGTAPYYVGSASGGGINGGFIHTSNSAATSFTPIKFASNFVSVAYNTSLGKYCATASDGFISATSTNGTTWTPSFTYSSGQVVRLGSIAASGSNFVSSGSLRISVGSTAYYSTDGVNWLPATGGATFTGIVDGSAGTLATTVGTTSNLYRSTDNGVTWATLGTGISGNYNNIAFATGTGYLVVGNAGRNIFSTNGFAWTAGATITGVTLSGCAIQNNTYIATDTNGNVYTSTNPAAGWTATTLASGVSLPSVGVTNKKSIVVTGVNGSIYSGRVVSSLISRTSGVTTPLYDVASKVGQVTVVGANGTILSSP